MFETAFSILCKCNHFFITHKIFAKKITKWVKMDIKRKKIIVRQINV